MGTLTREKVLELRDQFLELRDANYVVAARLGLTFTGLVNGGDFSEQGKRLSDETVKISQKLYKAMDPGGHWESSHHSSLANECIQDDEFITAAEMATGMPAVVESPEFPGWFHHAPVRFNFQLAWESARFVCTLPGSLIGNHLRKWEWGERTGSLLDDKNRDILREFFDVKDILKRIKEIHKFGGKGHFHEKLRSEFAAIARACPAEEPKPTPPQTIGTIHSNKPSRPIVRLSDLRTSDNPRIVQDAETVAVRADILKKLQEKPSLFKLWGRLNEPNPDKRSQAYIARDFFNGDEKKAGSALRQLRKILRGK